MDEFEIRDYLIQKYDELTDQKKTLQNEAQYHSRSNYNIRAKMEYLATRMDFLEEILEDLNIDFTDYGEEEL